MSQSQPPVAAHRPRAAHLLPPALLGLSILATAFWIRSELGTRIAAVEQDTARLAEASESMSRTLKLIRVESQSRGKGVVALIEQIEHWAPMLADAGYPSPEIPVIQRRLDEALDAVTVLGHDAVGPLENAIVERANVETRKWLLAAIRHADPAAAKDILGKVLRGTHRSEPSSRLRFIAADQLLALDRPLAGQILKEILEFESSQGFVRPLPPHLRDTPEAVIGTNVVPDFRNFISRFVESGHPDVANVLLMIISRPEHDASTIQECVKELGRLKAGAAAKQIKKLFKNPPGRVLNPIFQNRCLDAIAAIDGQEACPFFQEALLEVSHDIVVNKLQTLIKQYCQ